MAIYVSSGDISFIWEKIEYTQPGQHTVRKKISYIFIFIRKYKIHTILLSTNELFIIVLPQSSFEKFHFQGFFFVFFLWDTVRHAIPHCSKVFSSLRSLCFKSFDMNEWKRRPFIFIHKRVERRINVNLYDV
jgi:hypothetical protein